MYGKQKGSYEASYITEKYSAHSAEKKKKQNGGELARELDNNEYEQTCK